MGKNSTCHEDSRDSLRRKNVFKCTCYTIDHGKLLTLLQLRGLHLRGMVGPMGHLAILKIFLSQDGLTFSFKFASRKLSVKREKSEELNYNKPLNFLLTLISICISVEDRNEPQHIKETIGGWIESV